MIPSLDVTTPHFVPPVCPFGETSKGTPKRPQMCQEATMKKKKRKEEAEAEEERMNDTGNN